MVLGFHFHNLIFTEFKLAFAHHRLTVVVYIRIDGLGKVDLGAKNSAEVVRNREVSCENGHKLRDFSYECWPPQGSILPNRRLHPFRLAKVCGKGRTELTFAPPSPAVDNALASQGGLQNKTRGTPPLRGRHEAQKRSRVTLSR